MSVARKVSYLAVPAPIRRRIHHWVVQRRIAAYVPRVVTRRYAGEKLRVSLRDPLAEGWYDRDWGSQPEIAALLEGRLIPGARVFDLGAHQAVVALILSRIVGSTGEVVAVEAERHNVSVAEENVRLNNAQNLRVIHAAAAGRTGRVLFSESLNGSILPGGRAGKVEVNTVTVDGLAESFGTPDVVFIDVEGYEAEVLLGATRTLDGRATDFFVEIHDAETLGRAGGTAVEVVERFLSRGYRCRVAPAGDRGVDGEWQTISEPSMVHDHRTFLIATTEA